MLGTILNVFGIIAGGTFGLLRRIPLSPAQESFFKVTLGAFTVYYGLRLTWVSLAASSPHILRQFLLTVLSLILGKLVGKLMRIQQASNRVGQMASQSIAAAASRPPRPDEGFKVCAGLFCAAPLGLLGAVQEGLSSYYYPLAVKGVIDGLATMGLVSVFRWPAMMSALPVFALQGTVTLACSHWLLPLLQRHELINSVNAVGGLLVFSVALVILQLKKVALAEYLPSLIIAPLLTLPWR